MIPYFRPQPIQLFGGLQLQPFGLLVGLAVLLGAWLYKRRARQAGLPEREAQDVVFWAVVPGFFMAHWWTVFLYHPDWLDTRGWTIVFKFWEGLSSFGGFFGAFLGTFAYFMYLRKPWIQYADCVLQGTVFGWIFGRLGCTLVHDHPGNHTDFFLAIAYPDGPRHDLGFYELLYTVLILFPATLILHRLRVRPGMISVAVVLLYAPVRFVFDFLRIDDQRDADARYLGFTPAQHACIVVFLVACWLLARLLRRGPAGPGAHGASGAKAVRAA
jgi:phosphatidylglycerol:prolipoprotein diacylglycerol transferase